MPITQWLDDDVPIVDRDRWRLAVAGRPWSLAELDELVDEHGWELLATLDCTGGWYSDQRWSGVQLDRLLAASRAEGGRSLEVRSLTGYSRRLPASDRGRLLWPPRSAVDRYRPAMAPQPGWSLRAGGLLVGEVCPEAQHRGCPGR